MNQCACRTKEFLCWLQGVEDEGDVLGRRDFVQHPTTEMDYASKLKGQPHLFLRYVEQGEETGVVLCPE